ncbi:DUF262 domain-containing protein [Arthrobacter sp. KBS0702]|uniref:DUF262 domain-containing protein n=1 Tax=Arthrobacter sp. KBS0702 TaxID=2578107 RepID=UPI00110E144D|nr:DUF262 domain-containing protein [Arthrobacter sp. KBS0702]QDW29974.1 DUF262 domain-containing protein [Arthrobacter sp. KBS0702]
MAIDREKGVRVVTVGELLDEGLTIPSYQRPYSWEPATALQLFDDIREAFKAENAAPNALPHADQVQWPSYVLGAVILHRDNENVQIHVVDGQQRLLTLTILLDLLDEASEGHIEVLPIEQEDPAARVVRVRTELARRVRHMEEPAEAFADFIRSTCEIIRVETDDADEAFRVFDSQNYRGKSLLPHDLLKAYHLREMSDESDAMREALVEGWQNVPDAELDRLFSTYLWRIKRWTRGLSAPTFSTRYIDSFKGLTPKLASTPAARYHLAAQTAVPMLAAWVEHSDEANRTTNRTRFQIDAPVVAGRSFFEMVTFMLAELRRLREEGFDEQDGNEGKEKSWGHFASTDDDFRELPSRARYRYVSELYLAALLYYTNKFGEVEIREAKSRLFTWAYTLRTSYQRLQLVTVNNHASSIDHSASAFVLLRSAETSTELRRLRVEVKGRDDIPKHEQDLMRLLDRLAG